MSRSSTQNNWVPTEMDAHLRGWCRRREAGRPEWRNPRRIVPSYISNHNNSIIMVRKSKGNKFYAVAVGRAPGIYSTWVECQAEVSNSVCGLRCAMCAHHTGVAETRYDGHRIWHLEARMDMGMRHATILHRWRNHVTVLMPAQWEFLGRLCSFDAHSVGYISVTPSSDGYENFPRGPYYYTMSHESIHFHFSIQTN